MFLVIVLCAIVAVALADLGLKGDVLRFFKFSMKLLEICMKSIFGCTVGTS